MSSLIFDLVEVCSEVSVSVKELIRAYCCRSRLEIRNLFSHSSTLSGKIIYIYIYGVKILGCHCNHRNLLQQSSSCLKMEVAGLTKC